MPLNKFFFRATVKLIFYMFPELTMAINLRVSETRSMRVSDVISIGFVDFDKY